MKQVILAVLFASVCCSIIPIYGQTASKNPGANKAKASNSQTPKIDAINVDTVNVTKLNIPQQTEASRKPDDNKKESKSYFSRLIAPENLPNLILCIVGIAGVVSAVCTLKWIARQTHYMKKQTGILIQYNKATRDAADAALLNAKAIMNTERAWVVVEIISGNSRTQFTSIATNYGRTPAQMVGYNIQHSFAFSDDDFPPEPPQYTDSPSPEGQPFLVTDEQWTIESFSVESPKWNVSQIAQQPMLYWGVLRYRDIIGNVQHDTWFCYRYDATKDMFIMAGPPKYNQYT